jgi:hypothetical protein
MFYSAIEIIGSDDPRVEEIQIFCEAINNADTMCSDAAGVPELRMLQRAADNDSDYRLWAVYDTDTGELSGMVITDQTGQFAWLKAPLDIIGPLTYDAGQQITRALGTRAWGIMQNPIIRERIATAGPAAGCDDDERRVWWNG